MPGQDTAGKPILFLVEAEEDTAVLLKKILEDEGYDVIHAADGLKAQSQIAALPPPALVLMDMRLPHVSGLELLAQIRKKSSWSAVPVVIFTADNDKTDICKAIVAGATEYVLKPFKRDLLVARLQRFQTATQPRRAS
jgi:two-component system OmpR family response regulator